jgi:hypothetical protein
MKPPDPTNPPKPRGPQAAPQPQPAVAQSAARKRKGHIVFHAFTHSHGLTLRSGNQKLPEEITDVFRGFCAGLASAGHAVMLDGAPLNL